MCNKFCYTFYRLQQNPIPTLNIQFYLLVNSQNHILDTFFVKKYISLSNIMIKLKLGGNKHVK